MLVFSFISQVHADYASCVYLALPFLGMIPQHIQDQWLLAYIISSISERCYYAGWMQDIEYVLWHSLEKGPRRYGHGEISSDDIAALKMLSDRCGCWIFFDDLNEETAIPLPLWREKYTQHIENNPRAVD